MASINSSTSDSSAEELAQLVADGVGSCTTAAERAALVPAELRAAIARLKEQRDAVILAHYYVAPEVQAVADYVGDSFYLAKLAKSLPQQTIVLCGVEFMGESAKLLNPGKHVLLPEPAADCPMAHMVKRETVDAAREQGATLGSFLLGGRDGDGGVTAERQISPAARKLVAKDEGRLAFRNSDLEIRFDRVPAVRQQADVF